MWCVQSVWVGGRCRRLSVGRAAVCLYLLRAVSGKFAGGLDALLWCALHLSLHNVRI